MGELVSTITFVESEFCLWLCQWAEIDHAAYIAQTKRLFDLLDVRTREIALILSRLWWATERDG